MEEAPNGFVIWTTLVEGFIKQQLNVEEAAFGVKVSIQEQGDEQKIVQTVLTDKTGRYQFDRARPGKYVISPEVD